MDSRQASSLSTLIYGAIYRQEASRTLTNDSLWLCNIRRKFRFAPIQVLREPFKTRKIRQGITNYERR